MQRGAAPIARSKRLGNAAAVALIECKPLPKLKFTTVGIAVRANAFTIKPAIMSQEPIYERRGLGMPGLGTRTQTKQVNHRTSGLPGFSFSRPSAIPDAAVARIPSAGSLSTIRPSGRREGLSVTTVITATLSAVATVGSSLDSLDRSEAKWAMSSTAATTAADRDRKPVEFWCSAVIKPVAQAAPAKYRPDT
jgi:hypothetical protein